MIALALASERAPAECKIHLLIRARAYPASCHPVAAFVAQGLIKFMPKASGWVLLQLARNGPRRLAEPKLGV